MRKTITTAAIAAMLLTATAALAADPAPTCEASKLGTTAKYASCRLKADSKAAKTGDPADYSKCNLDKFADAEEKAGPAVCPSEGDEADIGQRTTDYADTIATLLAGDVPVECGNGVADGDDQCDGSDLDGQTCQGLGYTLGGNLVCDAGCGFDTSGCVAERIPATGETTSYGIGTDGDIRAGAVQAFADNADGTITDLNTGLMWEKKVQFSNTFAYCIDETGTCANPHNADNAYEWNVQGSPDPTLNGFIATIFLEQLNNRCNSDPAVSCLVDTDCSVPGGSCGFAGHRDWRLPNKNEFLSIIDNGTASPALNAVFHGASCGVACADVTNPDCACDASNAYWTATTVASNALQAWLVSTDAGGAVLTNKGFPRRARAVRGNP